MFRNIHPLNDNELVEIRNRIKNLVPLCDDIKVEIRVVPKEETSCKRGEYCVLIYSEQKDNFLQNVGYMGEQLDLWLASKDIGVCWYGLARPKEMEYEGLPFVIMLAIAKTDEKYFRKDFTKCSRRSLSDICNNNPSSLEIMNIVKLAPSACNSQPWYLESSKNEFTLYRTRGKTGIIPADKMSVINRVDIGIMILFLEVYFDYNNIHISRKMLLDNPTLNEKAITQGEMVKNVTYDIL